MNALANKVAGRVTTARNKLGTLQNVQALVRLGFKAQAISDLTSASMPDIRAIQEDEGVTSADKGGRKHRSINTLLESTRRHIEASLFLRSYEETLNEFYSDDTRPILNTDALINAYTYVKAKIQDLELRPDQAVMVATMYHEDKVKLSRCSHSRKCHCVFMVSTTPIAIRTHLTVGDCPMCREIYLMHNTRRGGVVQIPDSRTQRELLSRFLD